MKKRVLKAAPLQLPALQDPKYWGIILVRNLIKIIAILFAVLGLLIVVSSSLTQLEMTIKTNVGNIERCAYNQQLFCISLQLKEAQIQKVSINNNVRIEVTTAGSYRRHTLPGRVIFINKDVSPVSVRVALDPSVKSVDKISPVSALIVVGTQSGWNSLIAAFIDLFSFTST